MDLAQRLRKLESRYRSVLSAAVAAKAHYLALEGEPSSTSAGITRAKSAWRDLEARKAGIAAQIDALKELERQAIA
jgi:hypothetical protein